MSPPLLRRPPGGPADLGLAPVPVLEAQAGTLLVLLVLLVVTLLSGFTPLCVIRRTCGLEPDVRGLLLSLLSCVAAGVFLASCLLDLLPDYLQGFSQSFSEAGITLRFPLPEFIVALGFFLVLVLEQLILAFREQPSLQRQRRSLLADSAQSDGLVHLDFGARSALRAFVLVFSLSLHSALEGLAAGLLGAGQELPDVCLALMIHRSVASFGLSVQLSRGRLRRSLVAACLLLFAATSPMGVALGLRLRHSPVSPRSRLACCTLEGLAVGTFSYVTFMEVLPHELSAARHRIPRVAALLGGFTVVTATLFIQL